MTNRYFDRELLYAAFVFQAEGGYGFTVPDMDGFAIIVDGTDFTEAASTARKLLDVHLERQIGIGGEVPSVRSIEQLRADPDLREDWDEALFVVLLPAVPNPDEM